LLTTPKYTAHSSIEISDQSQQVLGQQFEQTAEDQNNTWNEDRFLATQVSILQSRSLADRVARRMNLYSNTRFFNAMQANREDFPSDSELRNGVISLIQDNLEVVLPADSRIVEIRFTSTDAKISSDIANAYAQEFIQANLQRKFDSSSYARKFVQEQLQEARPRVVLGVTRGDVIGMTQGDVIGMTQGKVPRIGPIRRSDAGQ